MKVLVTDANNRVALAVIRALGERGSKIVVCEQEPFCRKGPAGFYSRFVHRRVVLPDLRDEARFLETLRREAWDIDILLPISTNVLLAVSRHRELFKDSPVRIPVPAYDTLVRANQKDRLISRAARLGLAVPQTYMLRTIDDLKEMGNGWKFPLVVKLRDDQGTYLEPSQRYAIVEDDRSLRDTYEHFSRMKEQPVIQEFIPGEGYGCSMLMDGKGEVLASFCHRRIRELPSTGGPSTLCESLIDPELVEMSTQLLRALKWTGVAMVEFKKDRRDGRYKLMEINPRFWGALPLALACGVNFPDMLCRQAIGETVTPVRSYPAGRRLRFFFMDVAAVVSACRQGKGGNYLGGFVRDLFDLGIKDGILSASDPGAGVKYILNHLL